MRIIADILTDHKLLGIPIPDRQDEEERIIEIDAPEDVGLYIWLRDKKNTCITISEEDMNAHGYYKKRKE